MTIDSKTTKAQLLNIYNNLLVENNTLNEDNRTLLLTINAQKTQLIQADEEITRLRSLAKESIRQAQTRAAHEQLADALNLEQDWKIAEAFEPHLRSGLVTFSVKETCYSISTEDALMKKWIIKLHTLLGGRAFMPQHNGKKLTLNWKK